SNVTPGTQTFNNYDFPTTYQTRDLLSRPNAGEPNIDANWVTGKTMYMSGTQITRITWDDTKSPPVPTYTDVTPLDQTRSNEAAAAFCGRSDTGGLTWNPSTLVFAGTDCGAIHGHVKVGPDGTVYLPQRACGANQGMAVSFDNGATWPIERVPDSSTIGLNSSDPSVAPAPDGKTVYYAYQAGFGRPEVAVSSDHGKLNT